jgi:hypothetical protein
VNKRQYFIYDHLLVATNLLSFSFLTNALCMVLPMSAWPGGLVPPVAVDADQPLPDPARGLRLQHSRRSDQDVDRLVISMTSFGFCSAALCSSPLAQM